MQAAKILPDLFYEIRDLPTAAIDWILGPWPTTSHGQWWASPFRVGGHIFPDRFFSLRVRGKPYWRQMGRCLPDDSGMYHRVLRGGHPKGGLKNTDCMDPGFSIEISCILLGKDVGHNFPTCDLLTTDVLCIRVYAADHIWLVHQLACICPHIADNMQDGEAKEHWLW